MKAFHDYWTFSLIRGVLTLMAAVAVLVLPQATGSMLTLPLQLGLALACFALYSVLDGGATVLLAALLPAGVTGRHTVYVQAVAGMGTGVVIFLITLGLAPLQWAVWAAAGRAGIAAACQWLIAKDSQQPYGFATSYVSAAVLAMAAVMLPLTVALEAASIALALTTYLGLYGANEVLLSGRLLLREGARDSASADGQQSVEPAKAQQTAAAAIPGSCEVCPAVALCSDASLAAQWEQVAHQRQPMLVRSVRLNSLQAAAEQRCEPLRRSA